MSYKSSGIINFDTSDKFGGTTKASGLKMSGATSNALLKDSALSPGSLFRGTFMNNFDSTGVIVRKNIINEGRRTSTGKLLQKNAISILKQTRCCSPPYNPTLKETAPI